MIKDLRLKTDIELAELITKLKIQLLEIKFKVANGEAQESHKTRQIKKTIAMSKTVLSERDAKLSYTAYETRIIKQGKDGVQQFIPVKSLLETKEIGQQNQSAKPITKTKQTSKDVKIKKNINKPTNVVHDDKNTIYSDVKKVKTKKVDMKKKPLQNRKISSKG